VVALHKVDRRDKRDPTIQIHLGEVLQELCVSICLDPPSVEVVTKKEGTLTGGAADNLPCLAHQLGIWMTTDGIRCAFADVACDKESDLLSLLARLLTPGLQKLFGAAALKLTVLSLAIALLQEQAGFKLRERERRRPSPHYRQG